MNIYGLIYTLCAFELIDLLEFIPEDKKTIIMLVTATISIIIQIWRAVKGKKNKTQIETFVDKVYDKLSENKKPEKNNQKEVNTMYEVNMSPLVQKICNLYAQENGLNYPPCTQQMLNAIAEWLNKNAISEITSVTSQLIGDNKVTLNIIYTRPDGSTTPQTVSFTVPVINGKDGKDGKDGSTILSIVTKGSQEVDDYTETIIGVNTNDSETPMTFTVSAKNGENGVDGRGVTAFGSAPPTTDPTKPNYTVTPVTVVYSDGTTMNFNVYAKNGEPTQDILYAHNIHITGDDTENNSVYLFLTYYSRDNAEITKENLLDILKTFYMSCTGSVYVDGYDRVGVTYILKSGTDIIIGTSVDSETTMELQSITTVEDNVTLI